MLFKKPATGSELIPPIRLFKQWGPPRSPILGKCTNSLISHLGFVQLVDLVLGLDTDRKTFSRLVWNVGYTNEGTLIRNYLIDLALQNYDDAMTRAMWEVIDEISQQTTAKINEDKINIFSSDEKEGALLPPFLIVLKRAFLQTWQK